LDLVGRAAARLCGYDLSETSVGGVFESRQADEVTSINQLWVADITYIRLVTEFVYLAVILDAFSRNFSVIDLRFFNY
jgi:transposase InsO family protein